jgi:hypothetical protein
MVVGCAMYLFGPTNGGSTNGYWVCYVLFSPTNGDSTNCCWVWYVTDVMYQYLFGPTSGGSTNGCWVWYVPVWPNQWWFDQWLLGVVCTCLAQPMVPTSSLS